MSISASTPPALPRISLRRVLVGAFVLPFQHARDVVTVAGVPLLVVFGCSLAFLLPGASDTAFSRAGLLVVYLLSTSWLAITTHRMVLMDRPGPLLPVDRPALGRFGLFALTGAGIWVVYQGARLVLLSGLVSLMYSPGYVRASDTPPPSEPPEPSVLFENIDLAVSAMCFLLIGRLAILLPHIAVGGGFDLGAAWRASAGNGWRLAVVVGALPWILDRVIALMYREAATPWVWGLLQAPVTLGLLLEVVALSLAYRELSPDLIDGTTPPAPPPTG